MKIVFATGNQGKVREIKEIMKDMDVEVYTMKEAGIDVDVTEDGATFIANAKIKAKEIAALVAQTEAFSDAVVMADDSGLVIDALNGEPGVYSARYMGHDTSYEEKNWNLIHRLDGVKDEKRTARFVCAVAAVYPDGTLLTVQEAMEGRIAYEPSGENGFGYDPIFYLPEFGCTSADITPEEKNEISHRGKALRAISVKMQEKM